MKLREEGEPVGRALFDLVPFVVFFPSLFFYNLRSKVALYEYPITTVSLEISRIIILSILVIDVIFFLTGIFLFCNFC